MNSVRNSVMILLVDIGVGEGLDPFVLGCLT